MTAMGGEIGVPEIADVKIWWYQRKREDIETVEWVRKQTQESSVQKLCSTIAGALK